MLSPVTDKLFSNSILEADDCYWQLDLKLFTFIKNFYCLKKSTLLRVEYQLYQNCQGLQYQKLTNKVNFNQ